MKKTIATLSSFGSMAVMATSAFASDPNSIGISSAPELFQITSVGNFISALTSLALAVSGLLVFLFLVWGGLQWITSGGDKGKTEEARNRITAALVGLAIVASAWAVMQLVASFFGIGNVIGGEVTIPTPFE